MSVKLPFLIWFPGLLWLLSGMQSFAQQAEPADTLMVEDQRQRGQGMILDNRVDYSALDSIFFDIKNQRVYLFGQADMTYGQIHLEAAFVMIDFASNELFASGMPDSLGQMQGLPVFTEGPQQFRSQELRYNFVSKRGRTTGVITEEADGFVHGDVVKIQPNREVHVSGGKYTTCSDPDPHFHIAFRRAKIIPDDKIISSMAFLVIEGVPTPLFVPFGFFPNKSGAASGILIPSYGESRERGFFLERGGFYWDINDYLGLEIRGDIYSRGSWALNTRGDYRMRYRYSGNISLGYALNIEGEPNLPGYERRRDFRINWVHNQDPKARPNSVFRANVNAGSSQSSRYNPQSEQDYLSNTFSSAISYSANWSGRYNFSANLRHSQNTINRSVDLSLPEVTFGVSRFHPFRRTGGGGTPRWYEDISLSYTLNARNEIRTLDSLLFRPETLSEFRNGVSHQIPVSHSARVFRHFNLSNTLNYNERWYFSTIEKFWDEYDQQINIVGQDTIFGREATRDVPGFRAARDFSYTTSLSTRVYGMFQFRRGPVQAVRHVLNPTMSLSFRPDFADPFWGYFQEYYNPVRDEMVQYSIFEQGIYRGPEANRQGNLSFGLTNNLEMKLRPREGEEEGRKIALIDNFTFTGGYDFARDSLRFADIRLSGRTRLFGNFDITYGSSWSPYAHDSLGNRLNRFLWEEGQKLFQLQNTSWALNFNYTLRSGQSSQASGEESRRSGPGGPMGAGAVPSVDETGQNGADPPLPVSPAAVDFSVPWTLRFTYSFNYNARYMARNSEINRTYVQNLGVTGDIGLTPKWRIGFRTGYDFDRRELTYTSVNMTRDLHCWEMNLAWVPFGFMKSYTFTIRVKSSVLQDLKLSRRTHHLDRGFMD